MLVKAYALCDFRERGVDDLDVDVDVVVVVATGCWNSGCWPRPSLLLLLVPVVGAFGGLGK